MFKRFLKKILFKLGYKIYKIENKETLNIVGVDEKVKDIILRSSIFSMTGKIRMFVLSEAIKSIKNNSIKGDFVECGVFRGGSLGIMSLYAEKYKIDCKIYGYDTFGEPTINKIEEGETINIGFNGELREEQKPIIELYHQSAKKRGGGLISLKCGGGKTVLSLWIISLLKVIFKPHLIHQHTPQHYAMVSFARLMLVPKFVYYTAIKYVI